MTKELQVTASSLTVLCIQISDIFNKKTTWRRKFVLVSNESSRIKLEIEIRSASTKYYFYFFY